MSKIKSFECQESSFPVRDKQGFRLWQEACEKVSGLPSYPDLWCPYTKRWIWIDPESVMSRLLYYGARSELAAYAEKCMIYLSMARSIYGEENIGRQLGAFIRQS